MDTQGVLSVHKIDLHSKSSIHVCLMLPVTLKSIFRVWFFLGFFSIDHKLPQSRRRNKNLSKLYMASFSMSFFHIYQSIFNISEKIFHVGSQPVHPFCSDVKTIFFVFTFCNPF